MPNKDSYERRHRYLDDKITKLEKTNSYNRDLITNLKKKKLKLKDQMVSDTRSIGKYNKEFKNALAIGS